MHSGRRILAIATKVEVDHNEHRYHLYFHYDIMGDANQSINLESRSM